MAAFPEFFRARKGKRKHFPSPLAAGLGADISIRCLAV